jgi:citrate lyase beta subunit
MNSIKSIELGATLFVPATHKDLNAIVCHSKYPHLKSLLIDTEDGVSEESKDEALQNIALLLKIYEPKELLVFLRPTNISVLKEMLELEGIEKVTGFILPKFSLSNAEEYLKIFETLEFALMPSIEGSELFEPLKLHKLKELLLPIKGKIIVVRFGLEDMLKSLKMRRSCEHSPFDISATSVVLGNFIATFKSVGFEVSGGVYPCYKDVDGFIKDVKRDLQEGLMSKTIIHPNQIELTHEQYRVSREEFENALEICASQKAVFAQNSNMAEVVTMKPYSQEIVLRGEVYGLV